MRAVGYAASWAVLVLLPSCGTGPGPEILGPLTSGYALEKVTVTFADAASVFVAGAGLPDAASQEQMRSLSTASIEKGIKSRMSAHMQGARKAEAGVTVQSLNCPAVHMMTVFGGLSQLKAEIVIRDMESGAEIYPRRTLWAMDGNGFGPANIKDAAALEAGGDRNCPLMLALQFASSSFGAYTGGAISVPVAVPVRR